MAAPKVTIGELDLTSRVPSFPGVSVGIVIPLLKGNALEAFLVTNESDYLRLATPDETVKVGDDLGNFSAIAALAGTNRMWVARAQNAADTGGIVLASYAPLWEASTAYALGARVLPTTPDGFVYEATVAGTSGSSEPTFPSTIGATVVDGDVTWTQVSARVGNFAIPVAYADPKLDYDFGSSASVWAASTSYAAGDKVTSLATPNGFYYTTIAGGAAGSAEPAFPTTIGDTVVDGAVVWVCEGTLDDDAALIYGSNPGAWNKAIGIKVFSNAASPTVVKTAGAFHIQVFNGNTQVETGTGNNGFVVSRVTGAKDGFGQGIFLDDKLEASNYIRGISNIAIPNTVTANEQSTNLKMTLGADGAAVTDTQMISAAKFLENTAKFPLTVVCDAGFATAAYGTELDRIASSRGDCIAILSTPFAAEDASDYITQITDYRNTTLNLNSSWSALYTPHCKIADKFNGAREIFVAPDGYIASIISKTASTFDLWLPPAGFDDRAKIPVVDLRRRFDEGELDTLYDNEVNPILFEPGEGIIPWGQKTQLSSPSALDRINVRLLLLVIEPALKLAMKSFLFKLNTASTRALAEGRIKSFLQGIASAPIPGLVPGTSGQPAFRVQVDLQNNLVSDIENNRMVVWVFLRPALSIEEIPVTIALLNPGAELSLGI